MLDNQLFAQEVDAGALGAALAAGAAGCGKDCGWRGCSVWGSAEPVDQRQALHPAELPRVVRHQHSVQPLGLGRDPSSISK